MQCSDETRAQVIDALCVLCLDTYIPAGALLCLAGAVSAHQVMAAHDLYSGHNQREVQATVSPPARAVGGGDVFLEVESRTMLPVVLHNANGEWFHNCSAIHNLPEVGWEVDSGLGAGYSGETPPSATHTWRGARCGACWHARRSGSQLSVRNL